MKSLVFFILFLTLFVQISFAQTFPQGKIFCIYDHQDPTMFSNPENIILRIHFDDDQFVDIKSKTPLFPSFRGEIDQYYSGYKGSRYLDGIVGKNKYYGVEIRNIYDQDSLLLVNFVRADSFAFNESFIDVLNAEIHYRQTYIPLSCITLRKQ